MSNCIKIFRIPFYYSQPDEIEIKEMKDQKSKNCSSGPDHKLREKGNLRFISTSITNRSGNPVLDLDKNAAKYMYDYCSEQDYFYYFNQRERSHEMSGSVKWFRVASK
jgi:hypothetical protein